MILNLEACTDAELSFHYSVTAEQSIRTNMIVTFDGNFIGSKASSRDISHPLDLRILQAIRRVSECILVGATTAVGEKYRIVREADWGAPSPRLAVVSASLNIPTTAPMFESDRKPLIITSQNPSTTWQMNYEKLCEISQVEILPTDAITGSNIREVLVANDLHHVICEGGPKLLNTMFRADVIDEVCCTISPTVLGANFSAQPFGKTRKDLETIQVGHGFDYLFLRMISKDAPSHMKL